LDDSGPLTPRRWKRAIVSDNIQIIPPSVSAALSEQEEVLSDEEILDLAIRDIARLCGLEVCMDAAALVRLLKQDINFQDSSLLVGKCFMRHIRSGTTLIKQGDQVSAM
jgi:hypothetical protein